MNSSWHRIVAAQELPAGCTLAFDAGERQFVLCHADAGWFALDDLCTHAETRLSDGRLRRNRLVCPLHGACFDVRDGRVLSGPAERPLACHPVRVVEGQVEVLLP